MKTINQINKEIEKLNKLKTEIQEKESSKQTFFIEEFEVTHPVECRTYKEAEARCPKGFRLPEQWELFKIFGEDKTNPLRKDENVGFYWSSTLWENNCSKGLYLNRYLDVGSSDVNLAYSGSGGTVVYIREKK